MKCCEAPVSSARAPALKNKGELRPIWLFRGRKKREGEGGRDGGRHGQKAGEGEKERKRERERG